MIEVDEHGNSAVIHFACVECGCKFHAYPADTFLCVGKRLCSCPECGAETEEKNDAEEFVPGKIGF